MRSPLCCRNAVTLSASSIQILPAPTSRRAFQELRYWSGLLDDYPRALHLQRPEALPFPAAPPPTARHTYLWKLAFRLAMYRSAGDANPPLPRSIRATSGRRRFDSSNASLILGDGARENQIVTTALARCIAPPKQPAGAPMQILKWDATIYLAC